MVAVGQTGGGINIRNYTTRDGLASNVVNCGLQDRQGYIWFGTNHGLTRFDGHRFANFYVEEKGDRLIEGITHIVEDTTRNVLLMSGNDYRLLCFDLRRMCFTDAGNLKYPQEERNKEEQAHIARAQELGIDRGNKTDRRHDLHYLRTDDGRELFATIDNGFYLYDPKTEALQHFSASDKAPVIESDYINGILKDRTGCVWLVTTFAGIYRLELDEGDIIRHELPAANIRSLIQISNEEIAVADMEGNLLRYNLVTQESSIVRRLPHRIYATRKDRQGRLWMGTRGGGMLIDDINVDIPARQIYDIAFAHDGTVWVATLDAGLLQLRTVADETAVTVEVVNTYLKDEKIHELDIDGKGRLWIATENGVFVKDDQQIRTIYDKGKVVCICHSADGTVWAGSNGHGLLKIKGKKIEFIQVDNGLANNCVESVVCDRQGNVIAGTDQGISIVSSSDGTVRNIYSSQGLRANTYNENAILLTSNGRVLLGNLTGLVELTPKAMGMGSKGVISCNPPQLTCVDINDEPRYDLSMDEIRLAHNQNNLCFSFSSFAYKDMASVIYSYWLEGIDSDWRPSTRESQALYTNLAPGHYRLHVRCRMAATTWSEETVCDIYIAQPWYWTWWARILYLLIIVLIVWYEWHQYQQRLSLRRQLDQRLAALYALEVTEKKEEAVEEDKEDTPVEVTTETSELQEPVKPSSQKDRVFLDKLDRLILGNLLQTELDVNFIAQEMAMSYSTLHRRIKSLTGMTANEYVRKHRLAKAMQLLHEGLNATEVSMQCGFNSPSYFTRCFKAEYGLLPSEVS